MEWMSPRIAFIPLSSVWVTGKLSSEHCQWRNKHLQAGVLTPGLCVLTRGWRTVQMWNFDLKRSESHPDTLPTHERGKQDRSASSKCATWTGLSIRVRISLVGWQTLPLPRLQKTSEIIKKHNEGQRNIVASFAEHYRNFFISKCPLSQYYQHMEIKGTRHKRI